MGVHRDGLWTEVAEQGRTVDVEPLFGAERDLSRKAVHGRWKAELLRA